MINERLYKVILGPHVSEKTTIAEGNANQYSVKVTVDATKSEIKRAMEQLFEVTVLAVNTVKVKGKEKRFGRMIGRRKDWKKAYVTLAEGQSIDFEQV
ncbi:MAG: 50S ribosomal protein L23 [Gammaproteobacteria bacterium]|nr:MAG: 50S ribosomal protein L23 [Gammaproteobacteria bacterium]